MSEAREFQRSAHSPLAYGSIHADWTLHAYRPTNPKSSGHWNAGSARDLTLSVNGFTGRGHLEAMRLSFSNMDKARELRDQLTEFIDWVEEPFPESSRE